MIEDVANEEQWLYGENQEQGGPSDANQLTAPIENAVIESVMDEQQQIQELMRLQTVITPEDDLRPPGVDDDLPPGDVQCIDVISSVKPQKHGNGEESDEDDLNIVIGDIKTNPVFEGLNIKRGQLLAAATVDKLKQSSGKFSVDEFEAAGTINGVPIADYSLEAVEDKPWRKPGADISDYFNYGFNEDTWNAYCERQKRIRMQVGASATLGIPMMNNMPPRELCMPNAGTLLTPVGGVIRKLIPPPQIRRLPGSIDVIGGSTMASRRPGALNSGPPGNVNMIEVMTGEKRDFNNLPPPPIIPGAFPNFDDEYFNPEPTPYYDGFEPTQEVQWKPGQEPNWAPETKDTNHSGKIPVLTSSNLVSMQQPMGRSVSNRYDDISKIIKREPRSYRSRSRSRSPYRDSDRGRGEKSDRHKDKHKRDRSRSRTRRHRSRSRSESRHRSSHKKKKSRHHDKEESD